MTTLYMKAAHEAFTEARDVAEKLTLAERKLVAYQTMVHQAAKALENLDGYIRTSEQYLQYVTEPDPTTKKTNESYREARAKVYLATHREYQDAVERHERNVEQRRVAESEVSSLTRLYWLATRNIDYLLTIPPKGEED